METYQYSENTSQNVIIRLKSLRITGSLAVRKYESLKRGRVEISAIIFLRKTYRQKQRCREGCRK